ncbi:MAG: SDR family NAD(P)-dependent oxidoreductase [Armatimonadetes bacterium]|nr:SDR family NAD(P)-dependent oxidoreductase [Armatimonadota bacterium]
MTEHLRGRVAVITGGGSGIGRAVALAMAAEGASVVVNDKGRSSNDDWLADQVVADIVRGGGAAVANHDSIATMSGGESVVATAVKNYGRVDILVNCAANFKIVRTIDMSETDWDSIMDVHVKGHLSCVKAALPLMLSQSYGRIVNFSSQAAFGRVAASLPYSTAKAAILGFTNCLSVELQDAGITVNAILPSAATPLFPGVEREYRTDGVPYPASLEPDWIAPVVVYLASEQAGQVTGQFIYAAGGDLCIYEQPLRPRVFLRKTDKWVVEELHETIAAMIET